MPETAFASRGDRASRYSFATGGPNRNSADAQGDSTTPSVDAKETTPKEKVSQHPAKYFFIESSTRFCL